MNATERVARTRSRLCVAVIVSAPLWTAAVLCGVLALELLVDNLWRVRIPNGWDWNIALLVAVTTGVTVLWRGRFVYSKRRVALWMEERVPSLQYALITASDPHVTGDVSMLESAIDRSNIDALVAPAVFTPVVFAGVALSVMAGCYAAVITMGSALARTKGPEVRFAAVVGAQTPDRLLHLSVVISPPAYAGGKAQTLADPSAVTALVGSGILVRGSGASDGIESKLAERDVHVSGQRGWEARFTMPSVATTMTLKDREYDRVIAVIPVIDQPPAVTMTQPTRDTVWRHVPAGSISFIAHATDDIGLGEGHFEYTVTTGSGEIFKSRTSSFGDSRPGGARTSDFHASLALASLGLTEGAILSVRAVVADNNTISGPSVSNSDTRTFRVARADEYDSLAVDAAPPPPLDRSLLTERMLINSADSLLQKRASLPPRAFVTSSGRIGFDQADLRKKVYNILYEQDEAGGTQGVEGDDEELDPQLVLNRDLKEAYDAMWDAERSLNVGEIAAARPFMTRALKALDRARLADRLYLRGRPPRVIVNVEKVRLTAKEKGISNVVVAQRSRTDTIRVRLDQALDSALTIAQLHPDHFLDALTRLRVQATSFDTAFATALGSAVDAFRAGTDMTPALVRARRALLGAPRRGDARLPWSGTWRGVR